MIQELDTPAVRRIITFTSKQQGIEKSETETGQYHAHSAMSKEQIEEYKKKASILGVYSVGQWRLIF